MKKTYKLEETNLKESDLIDDDNDKYNSNPPTHHSGLTVAIICLILTIIVFGTLGGIIYYKEKQKASEVIIPLDPVITVENDTDLGVSYEVVDNLCTITFTKGSASRYSTCVYEKINDDYEARIAYTLIFNANSTTCIGEFVANNDSEYVIRIFSRS